MSIKRIALYGGRHPASAYYTPRDALLPKRDRRNAMNTQRNIGIAAHIGRYSDAVEVSGNVRWLISAGTPGMSTEGGLPADFSSQATLAWENVIRILHDADMGLEDVVKVTQYLVGRSDLDTYREIRNAFLGEARPASMLSFVSELIYPEVLIELEIVAAKRC